MGLAGPSLRFHVDAVAALTGADFEAEVDGSAVPLWTSVLVKAGSVLTVGKVGGAVLCSLLTTSLVLRVSCITVLELRLVWVVSLRADGFKGADGEHIRSLC